MNSKMNSKCNFCNELVVEKDIVHSNYVQCTTCMIPSHRECYHANNSKCMTMGCLGDAVYMTPKPIMLPAKLEDTVQDTMLVNDEPKVNLPATQYFEQEDRIEKIIERYNLSKHSVQGGVVEILESVYYVYYSPLKLGKCIRETGRSFLEEYSKLEKNLEEMKKRIDQAEGEGNFSFFSTFFGSSAIFSYFIGNYALLFAAGAISIADYGVKRFVNDKRSFLLRSQFEEMQRHGLADLKQKYAPRLHAAECKDQNEREKGHKVPR